MREVATAPSQRCRRSDESNDEAGGAVAVQEALAEAVDDGGYEAAVLGESDSGQLSLVVAGMSCASCVAKVEAALGGVAGVIDCTVNLDTSRAKVGALFWCCAVSYIFENLDAPRCSIMVMLIAAGRASLPHHICRHPHNKEGICHLCPLALNDTARRLRDCLENAGPL